MAPDPYATHLEALAQAVCMTQGGILELGCGHYSTPMLAGIARAQNRRLLVQAANADWAGRFRDLAEVQLADWPRWSPPRGPWGVVLLDSEEPARKRGHRLPQMRADVATRGAWIVVHDAEVMMEQPEWPDWKKGYDVTIFRKYIPMTALCVPVGA